MKKRKKQLALSIALLLLCILSGSTVHAAEPVYTEEELEAGEQSFTMPVIVNATDHSGGGSSDSGDGNNGGGNNDGGGSGGQSGSSDQGGNGGSGGGSSGNGGTDTSVQTFLVTVTDRFVNRAGEEQLVSVRSIGKYRRGTYLLFSATKTEGYTVSGEKLQAVTVEKDMQIVFTYVENQSGNTASSGAGAERTSQMAERGEKTDQGEKDNVSGNAAEEELTEGDLEASEESGEEEQGDPRRTPVIRRLQEAESEAGDTETEEETEAQEIPEDTSEEEQLHIPWWVWLILTISIIAVGIIALAMTGKLSYLWLLFLSRFFRNSFKPWHGILTKQENRFIDIVHGESEDGYSLQELIDRGGMPAEVLRLAEESADMTYLPPGSRIAVSYQDGGEYPAVRKLPAEEGAFYDLLQKLSGKGEVIATFFNDPAEIEFVLNFKL